MCKVERNVSVTIHGRRPRAWHENKRGKTKLMKHCDEPINTVVMKDNRQQLITITKLKHRGSIINQEASKPEVHARIAL